MTHAVRQIDSGHEARRQARTHLFVAATLYADAGSTSVTIRNMSQSGALIEGAVLPGVGERISLKRGQLQAAGAIAWRAGRRAGVRLEAAVHVRDWMSRQVSAGQQRVDELVSIVRNHGPKATALPPPSPVQMSCEAELHQLRLDLGELETALLKDIVLVATHPEIQTIDIAIQRVDRILKDLRAAR